MTHRLPVALALIAGCRVAPITEPQRFPAGTEFSARYLTVEGTRIRYIVAGQGTPVIFIHGLGASMYAWRKNLAPVTGAGFRIVAFDSPGFGFSGKPVHGYGNASYARLVAALMDSLHVPNAVLVGHSMGGAIAAEVAIEFPKRVSGLVLIGAAGLGTRQPLLYRVARWPVLGSVALSLRNWGFIQRVLKSTYANPSKVTKADVDQYYAPVPQPDYGRALRGALREFRFDALEGRLGAIQAPTLVLWGEEDRWVAIPVGRTLASRLPRSAFLSVPHAGHAVQEEAADEVNGLLIKFLKDGLPRVPDDLALWVKSNIFSQPSG